MRNLHPLILTLVLILISSGCASTHYKATTHNHNTNVTDTRELNTTTFGVNRQLGEVKLGEDSLKGAVTEQTVVAQLLGEALLARVKK